MLFEEVADRGVVEDRVLADGGLLERLGHVGGPFEHRLDVDAEDRRRIEPDRREDREPSADSVRNRERVRILPAVRQVAELSFSPVTGTIRLRDSAESGP